MVPGYQHGMNGPACRLYRVVPVPQLLQHFASDRSHMRRPDGEWSAPPPPYPCIIAAATGHTNTLPRHRDMTCDLYRSGPLVLPPVPTSKARPNEEAGPAAAAARQQAQHAAQGGDAGGDAGPGRDHAAQPEAASNDRPSVPAIVHLASLHSYAFGQVFNESDMLQAFGVTCEQVLSTAYAYLPEVV